MDEEWVYNWLPEDFVGKEVGVIPLEGSVVDNREFAGVEYDPVELEFVAYVHSRETRGLLKGVHPARIRILKEK